MPPTSHARQPLPLDPPRTLLFLVLRKARSLSSTSTTGRRAQLSSATWYWRHRVDASDGESGGRGAYCDEDEHARPAAAPSHLQSSFCHTCCPYRGLCGMLLGERAVERSEERLNNVAKASVARSEHVETGVHYRLGTGRSLRLRNAGTSARAGEAVTVL